MIAEANSVKKLVILIFLAALAVCGPCRVDARWRFQNSGPLLRDGSPAVRASVEGVEYHSFARTWQTIDLAGENVLVFAPTMKGLAITHGHSFLLHQRPLLRMFHIGFDATWADINFNRWSERVDDNQRWMYKLDLGLGFGPAIHFSPGRRFGMHAYWHYDPTLSAVTHNFAGDEEGKFELVAGYASYHTIGAALSWGIYSAGVEYRYGGGMYKGVRIPDVTIDLENYDFDELLELETRDWLDHQRHTMHGWRLFVSFRF